MELLKRLNLMFASAGRLLDFGGSYNYDYLMQRLSVPGYLRDRDALQGDIDRATRRLEDTVYWQYSERKE